MAYIEHNLLDKKELGERLLILRKAHGFSKQRVAKEINMHVNNYSNNEIGKCEMSLQNRNKIAKLFDIPIDFLLYSDFQLDNTENNILNPEFVKRLPEKTQSLVLDIEQTIKKHL